MSTVLGRHVYAGNRKKYKRIALFLTAFCVLFFVISLIAKPADTGYLKMQIVKYVFSPVFAITSLYYWFTFYKSKQFQLVVNADKLCWVDMSGTTELKWLEITEITLTKCDNRKSVYCSIKLRRENVSFSENKAFELDNFFVSPIEFASNLEEKAMEYKFHFLQEHNS